MQQTLENGSVAGKQTCFQQIGLDGDILGGFFLALVYGPYAVANIQTDVSEQAYHLLKPGGGFSVWFGRQQKQ